MGETTQVQRTTSGRRGLIRVRTLGLAVIAVASIGAFANSEAQQLTPVTRLQFDVNVLMPPDTDRADQESCRQGFFVKLDKGLQVSLGGNSKLVDYGCYFITGNSDAILRSLTDGLTAAGWQLRGEIPMQRWWSLSQVYRNGQKAMLAIWKFPNDQDPPFTLLFALLYKGPG